MKKIRLLSLILALCMVITMFAACGDEGYYDDDEDEDEEETTETTSETKGDTDPTETGPDNTVPEGTEPSADTDATTPNVDEPEPSTPVQSLGSGNQSATAAGTWNGSTYTNEYLGLQITFGSSWAYYNVNELQENIQNVQDMFSGTAVGDAMANMVQFYDMSAQDQNTGANVNVVYQKLDATQQALYKNMTEEQVIDITLSQKDLMIQSYAAAGITVTSMEKVDVTFLGKTHYALKTEGTVSGIPIFYLQFFNMADGEWGTTLTVGSFTIDTTQEIADMFKPA